jgi:hypothetical protein
MSRARLRGTRPPGFAVRVVFCVCQKMAGRPFTSVNTNWERARRGRSSTRSIAAPRLRQNRTGTCSRMSGSSGQSSPNGWQYTRDVVGQTSLAFNTRPPSKGSFTQERELGVGLGVASDKEHRHCISAAHPGRHLDLKPRPVRTRGSSRRGRLGGGSCPGRPSPAGRPGARGSEDRAPGGASGRCSGLRRR